MDKLSPQQKAFADYYIQLGNATEAYKRAYPKCKKDGTARTNSSKLLTNTNISQYIEERIKSIESNRIAKAEEVLEYLTKVMRGEEKDQFDLDAPLNERTRAAELIGKRYALFTDKTEHSGDINYKVTLPDVMKDD